jgi:ribonucleotide monophosphatase NagD (HAD superfamily)
MDIGAFVAALEYATGKQAIVIGKPSWEFFRLTVTSLGLTAAKVAVIGDDVDSDVGGGQAAGLTGVLVQTGKYREEFVRQSSVRPDHVIASIADLPALLR